MPKQSAFDVYVNSGGGQTPFRKIVQNNPEAIPMGPLPGDFGLLGWSIDPMDVSTITQALVSGTQYLVRLSNPCNLNANNNNAINKVGLHLGAAVLATPGTYSGLAVYSYVPGAAAMTKLADTGADTGAAWVTSGASKYYEGTLTAPVSSAPGYLYASFIATFTTEPNCYAATITANTLNIKGVAISQGYTNGTQTSFPASIAIPGSTSAMAFLPLMGVANS
jgi:hypothetical protein